MWSEYWPVIGHQVMLKSDTSDNLVSCDDVYPLWLGHLIKVLKTLKYNPLKTEHTELGTLSTNSLFPYTLLTTYIDHLTAQSILGIIVY